MLSEIRRFLQQRGQATLAEIASHLGSEPDAVRGMLQVWMRKGEVSQYTNDLACGTSCNQCNLADVEIYHWHGPDGAITDADMPGCDLNQ